MRFTKVQTRKWQDLIAFLEDYAPADHAILIRRKPMGKMDEGEIDYNGSRYQITVKSTLNYAAAVDALLEEWAHALAGYRGGDSHEREDHGPHWGEAYATLRQLYIDWRDHREPKL